MTKPDHDEPTLRESIDHRGIARLTMNRPEVRNAFNQDMVAAITSTMRRLGADDDVRVVVLSGAGQVFSAGADLSMMHQVAQYSAEQNRQEAQRMGAMLASIAGCPKPVVARVNGPALGGGVGLVAAADIAIGVDTAFFALSEVRLGLIPAVISPFVVRALGRRATQRYALSGERFDAALATSMGLLHRSICEEDLDSAVDAMLDALLAGGPHAQREAKDLIDVVVGLDGRNDDVIDELASRIARVRASEEGTEGITSFLQKRKPNWVGE